MNENLTNENCNTQEINNTSFLNENSWYLMTHPRKSSVANPQILLETEVKTCGLIANGGSFCSVKFDIEGGLFEVSLTKRNRQGGKHYCHTVDVVDILLRSNEEVYTFMKSLEYAAKNLREMLESGDNYKEVSESDDVFCYWDCQTVDEDENEDNEQ